MSRWIAGLLIFFGASLALSAELKLVSASNRADANYCGDINIINQYKIVSGFTSPSIEAADILAIEKVTAPLTFGGSNQGELLVIAQYQHAFRHLVANVDPEFDKSGALLSLGSCQELAALRKLGLSVKDGRLEPARPDLEYITVGFTQGRFATGYLTNVVIDRRSGVVTLFLIW
jgi:hypothetical protein